MKYGDFVDHGRAFRVTNPCTPRPWMNVLFNNEYGVFFSQTGQGYSFYKSVLLLPITYVDVFTYVPQWPQTGKFVYLRDLDTGDVWSLAPTGANQEYDAYACLHAPAGSTITARKHEIQASFRMTVPPGDDPVELWTLTFRNEGKTRRRLRLYPFQELRLASFGSAATDVFTYALAAFDSATQAIVARNNNSVSKFKYGGAFMIADYPVIGYDCRLESFIGNYGRMDAPLAAQQGACTGSQVSAERICTVLEGEIALEPGETRELNLLFGIGTEPETLERRRQDYLAPGRPREAIRQSEAWWQGHYETVKAETPFEGLDWLANTWYKHGALLTSRFVRGDIKGYRDIVQDIMGVCPLEPSWTRRWLLESLKHQDRDGLVLRCYDTIAERHDYRRHRDCGLWLPMTFSDYIRETGDAAILDTVIPFRDSGEATAWGHMLANILRVGRDRGTHDLCLIGDGDWNDSLDQINREGKGESAWLTAACVHAINLMEEMAGNTGRTEGLDDLKALRRALIDAIETRAWDGDWYIYGFADDGRPVGSRADREGQVHLNMQTWSIFSGIAHGERLAKLLTLIDGRMDSDFGPVLADPAYTAYDPRIGKMSAKNPGHCENGPVYSHGVCFKMLADALLGRGDQAMESFRKLSPFNPKSTQDRYAAPPFSSPRYLVSRANPAQEGMAWYPYFTAMPAWMMTVLHQWLFGVRPWYDALLIDPVIPRTWPGFRVTRRWRGATYQVEVTNPDGVCCGVTELLVNGKHIAGNRVPPAAPGETVEVRCRLGPGGTRPNPRR
jgi:cellobiose phosphorylase